MHTMSSCVVEIRNACEDPFLHVPAYARKGSTGEPLCDSMRKCMDSAAHRVLSAAVQARTSYPAKFSAEYETEEA